MANEYLVNSADMTAVADAIRTKGGTSDALEFPGGFVDAVGAIQTGSGEAKEEAPLKDVNFYDYDGTRLYSYTTAEAAALTELPPLPVVDGLTYTGWSWTLEEVTSLNADDPWAEIVAFCYSNDGFWLHITIGSEEDCKGFELSCYPSKVNDIRIDWGDGTVETPEYDKAYEPSSSRFTHDYASPGKYSIHVTPITGKNNMIVLWSPKHARMVDALWQPSTWDKMTELWSANHFNPYVKSMTVNGFDTKYSSYHPYNFAVMAVGGVSYTHNGDYNSHKVHAMAKSTTVTAQSIGFGHICAEGSIRLPDGLTEIKQSNGTHAHLIRHVHIPEGVTTIGYRAVSYLYSLDELTLPSTLTSIAEAAFENNLRMKRYIIKAVVPPTLDGTNAFNKIPGDCVFYVPDESITAYQEATNWSTWADRYHGLSELEG